MTAQSPSSSPSPEELWTAMFKDVCERIGPCFARSETRLRAQAYLRGVLSPVERKNGWQLAEEAGETTPYAMQYLLDRAVWDSEQVRDLLRTYVRETIGDANAVLVIDETGFLKKGTKSVGVQRQYSGTAGRIENCQIGVFLTYASQAGHTLLDRELYLPKSWTQAPERCREADVPTEVVFATKAELAARMLWRTLDGGMPAAWVTGDTVYGSHPPLRAGLEARSQAYALAVACKERVEGEGGRKRVDQVARQLAADEWQRLSAGSGSKGPRFFDWARVEVAKPEKQGWQRWLIIGRSLVSGAKPADLAYFLVFAPSGTTLAEMVAVIGSRWTVEPCFEEAKGEVGLDEYEVRSWQGWYRHMTLCMFAHAFLTALRTQSQTPMPLSDENEGKKALRPSQPHSPSQSLNEFRRQRGPASQSSSL
jgi:SRSO17 transposase